MENNKPVEFFNFIDAQQQDKIYNHVTSGEFCWRFKEDSFTARINTAQVSTPSFENIVHPRTAGFDHIIPILDMIETKGNLKIKDFLQARFEFLLNTKYTLPSLPYKPNAPRRDYDYPHYVAVYYINETDGETIVYNQTAPADKYYPLIKSMPDKGKLILFNGNNFYATSCPKIFTKRITLTVHFTAELNA